MRQGKQPSKHACKQARRPRRAPTRRARRAERFGLRQARGPGLRVRMQSDRGLEERPGPPMAIFVTSRGLCKNSRVSGCNIGVVCSSDTSPSRRSKEALPFRRSFTLWFFPGDFFPMNGGGLEFTLESSPESRPARRFKT